MNRSRGWSWLAAAVSLLAGCDLPPPGEKPFVPTRSEQDPGGATARPLSAFSGYPASIHLMPPSPIGHDWHTFTVALQHPVGGGTASCLTVADRPEPRFNGQQFHRLDWGSLQDMDTGSGKECHGPSFLAYLHLDGGTEDLSFELADSSHAIRIQVPTLLRQRGPILQGDGGHARGEQLRFTWDPPGEALEGAAFATVQPEAGNLPSTSLETSVDGGTSFATLPASLTPGRYRLRISRGFTLPVAKCEGVPSCATYLDAARSFDLDVR